MIVDPEYFGLQASYQGLIMGKNVLVVHVLTNVKKSVAQVSKGCVSVVLDTSCVIPTLLPTPLLS